LKNYINNGKETPTAHCPSGSVNNCVQQKESKIEPPVFNSLSDPLTIKVLKTQKYQENLTNETHCAGKVIIGF